MNALKPPYVIRVVNTADLAPEIKELIYDFSSAIKEARARRHSRIGEDVAVSLEITPQRVTMSPSGRYCCESLFGVANENS
jgi:hypothetical protein